MKKGPVALVILDGWGVSSSCDFNAACIAETPVMDRLRSEWPNSLLKASGQAVGLPDGQMGNSEVGHLNIGAGRVVYQDLSRITLAIEDGSFYSNPALKGACEKVAAKGTKLHLLGLLSNGGVHSHNKHLYALIKLAKECGVKDVCVHAFLDGRDTPPQSGVDFLEELESELSAIGLGRVATISGRYWVMDRDNRWDRVEKSYLAMTSGIGNQALSSAEAIAAAYADGKTDEFVAPTVIGSSAGTIDDDDAVIFFNFRADRAREITRALALESFDGFVRKKVAKLADYVCLTEYDETFGLPIAFPSETYPQILAQVVADAGLKQLRIAETEKYAHVTFFFNGGVENAWPGEDRVLIPSPQEVATYDQKPSMSAAEVTDEVLKRIAAEQYEVIILNFANCDMVGHTGILDAAVEAVQTVDTCLGRVVEGILAAGGKMLITADHGNCEQMMGDNNQPHTAHTSNLVPFILVDPEHKEGKVRDGILADLAPTIIDLLDLEKPEVMTGTSLIEH